MGSSPSKPIELFPVSLPSTGTVNIPVSATWSATAAADISLGQIRFFLVQDNPKAAEPSSEIQTKITKGQTEGIIPFTATQPGTFHLEAGILVTAFKLGNKITIIQTSTSTAPQRTQTSISSTYSSSTHSDDRTVVEQPPATTVTPLTTSTTPVAEEDSMSRDFPTSTTTTSDSSGVASGEPSSQTQISTSSSVALTTSTPPPTGLSPSGSQLDPNLLGAILGTILGIITILAAVLLCFWYRRRLASRTSSRIVFDEDTMAPWWTTSHFDLGKKSRFMLNTQLLDDDLDTSTIAPSDSVSQVWTKQKVFEKRRPLRESSDLTIITEK